MRTRGPDTHFCEKAAAGMDCGSRRPPGEASLGWSSRVPDQRPSYQKRLLARCTMPPVNLCRCISHLPGQAAIKRAAQAMAAARPVSRTGLRGRRKNTSARIPNWIGRAPASTGETFSETRCCWLCSSRAAPALLSAARNGPKWDTPGIQSYSPARPFRIADWPMPFTSF